MQINTHQAVFALLHLGRMVEEFATYLGDGLSIDCNGGLANISKYCLGRFVNIRCVFLNCWMLTISKSSPVDPQCSSSSLTSLPWLSFYTSLSLANISWIFRAAMVGWCEAGIRLE